jgi:phage gp46-like protein
VSNISLLWDSTSSRGDWQVFGGRLSTGHLLTTAVLISLFTDRVAQPDYAPPDGSGDRRGWWHDTFAGIAIGSRLWQLHRRKIANRPQLIAEATDICREAVQWLIDSGLANAVDVLVTSLPAGSNSQGTLLSIQIKVIQPNGEVPVIRALWRSP